MLNSLPLKYISLFAIIGLLLWSCQKTATKNSAQITNGVYVGTFMREGVNTPPSQVSLTFNDNTWSGTASQQNYPALCQGSFVQNSANNGIIFQDSCIWTADFDWSLILNSEFQLSEQNDTIIMKKSIGNGLHDVYKLKKQ